MHRYSYVVTEYDRARPWLVVGREARSVELADGENFYVWAHQRWPSPRWGVALEPRQLDAGWPD